MGELSGFLQCGVIVTAGHALGLGSAGGSSPATTFKVLYSGGSEEDVTVLQAPPPSNTPDLMLLKGSHSAAPNFRGRSGAVMDTVYAFGYSGGSEGIPAGQLPSCSKGLIASVTPGAVAITAQADDGFSGGPVVDHIGRLVGVVIRGGVSTTTLRVGITSSYDVHTYLLQAGQPGLSP